jgi:hypothetical protein
MALRRIVIAALPRSLRASLDRLLVDDIAGRIALRCQADDARRGESPISRSSRGRRRPIPSVGESGPSSTDT